MTGLPPFAHAKLSMCEGPKVHLPDGLFDGTVGQSC
jgi:hypothetical protein